MKLFMVLFLAGKIGGTAGPLPYDMAECERRAAQLVAQCVDRPNNPYSCAEFEPRCEWHYTRPANDPTAGDRVREVN